MASEMPEADFFQSEEKWNDWCRPLPKVDEESLLQEIASSNGIFMLDTHFVEKEYAVDNSKLALLHRRFFDPYTETSRQTLLKHGLVCTMKICGTEFSGRPVWCLFSVSHPFCTKERSMGMPPDHTSRN